MFPVTKQPSLCCFFVNDFRFFTVKDHYFLHLKFFKLFICPISDDLLKLFYECEEIRNMYSDTDS